MHCALAASIPFNCPQYVDVLTIPVDDMNNPLPVPAKRSVEHSQERDQDLDFPTFGQIG